MSHQTTKAIVIINLILGLILTASCATITKKLSSAKETATSRSTTASATESSAPESTTEYTSIPTFMLPALNETQQAQAAEANRDYQKALAFLKNGDNQRALTMFRSITGRFPDLSGPWLNQGIIHLKFNDLTQAEEAFKNALAIYPDNPYTLNMLGIVLREQGMFDKAKQSYEKALIIDKHYAKAHLNLGILLDLYLRDLPLALDHFEQYQSLQQESNKQVSGWIKDLKRRIKASKA